MLFLGTYQHTLDNKNRLIIPSKFRSVLRDSLCYVSKGFDNCLEIRGADNFYKWAQKLSEIPEAKNKARALKRKIMALSEDVKCDSVGRIKISNRLLEHVGITKDVVIIGNNSKFELWSPDVWEKYKADNIDIEDIADTYSEWI